MQNEGKPMAATLAGLHGVVGPLPKVEYTVDIGDAPSAFWQLRSMHLREALAEPFTLLLTLVTEDLDTDTDALLGASLSLEIARDTHARHVCGIIDQVEHVGVVFDRLLVNLRVVPALQLLDQRVDTRLWQNVDVPTVIAEVLAAALGDYGRSCDGASLSASYEPREYIVQYRESDLDFVQRLMEEEGISYWFDHESDDGKELLVLADSNDNVTDIETIDGNPDLHIITNQADGAEIESFQEFGWLRELTSTAIDQRIFDWLQPTNPGQAQAPIGGEQPSDERGRTREVYHHGHFVEADSQPRTTRKLLHLRQRDRCASGRSNITSLMPGRKFALVEAAPVFEREYLVREVVHVADCPEVIQGEPPSDETRYANSCECLVFNAAAPYHPPPRTPRPRIHGPQTAIVTGPAGEEIHTDEHGRVKVLFSWDRVHAPSDDTSMWIRVAHHWAGPGFGTFFVPRIGMEVVVEFIEGDPAKPLINGCVYNGDNAISVGVPDNKTQSTIRTRSSPASEGYNEITFEDAAGSEQIILHAQKDFNETVEHDHATTVHNDQTISVDNDQTTTVGGNQTNTISGNQTTSVSKDQSNSVSGHQTNTVSKDQTETISGEATLTIQKNRTITIKGSQAVTIDGSSANSGVSGSKLGVTGDYKVDASKTIEIQAPTHILLTSGSSSIKLEPGKITLMINEAASLVLDANAMMISKDGSQVLLDTNACMSSSGNSYVLLDANASVHGDTEASVSGPVSKLLGGDGSSSVETNAAGVAVSGSKVDVSAAGVATVAGALVKIN